MTFSSDRRQDRVERFLFLTVIGLMLFVFSVYYPPTCNSVEHVQAAPNQAESNTRENRSPSSEGVWADIHTHPIDAAIAFFTMLLAFYTYQLVTDAADTAKRQLRAYVGVDSLTFELANIDAADYTPTSRNAPQTIFNDFLVVNAKNSGETPAFNVVVFGYVAVMNNPWERLPDDMFTSNDSDRIDNSSGVRSSTSKFMLHPDKSEAIKISIEDILPIREARITMRNIYVFGRIYYNDIYGRPWRTKFCYQWEWWHGPQGRFVPYEEYNDEDSKTLI